ncbi:MAG: hypothetical protein R2844_15720 [Caldilineales bacterium]
MAPTASIRSRSDLGNSLAIRVGCDDGWATCQPGQFYLLRAGTSWTPYLRRALFPFFIDPNELGFLIRPGHDIAAGWLAAQPVGSALDLIGPLGKGFVADDQQRRILLAAENSSLAVLLPLIPPALARQASVVVLHHAHRSADLLPASVLPPAVEYYTSCDEPSPGQPSTMEDELERALSWADGLFLAGPASFLARTKTSVAAVRFAVNRGFAQAVAPAPLRCGVGACLACLVDTGRGRHRACVRGPVFDLGDLAL